MADPEAIWREFPKSLTEFEDTFPDEDSHRRILINLRWGESPRCSRCNSDALWELESGRDLPPKNRPKNGASNLVAGLPPTTDS